MDSSMVVPVIDVQDDNFKELWPAMVVAIQTASFVALDTELSGLGNRKSLLAESIEERYRAIYNAARSRSILSLGIACYKKQDRKAADTYQVQVYNLTLLCSEEYIIEPQSVHFLVQHGFDFNKQYAHGIPYCKGNNRGGADDRGVNIRALFTELLRVRKPLLFHNGLIDMAFLYQCFYAHLPDRLTTFTADLSEMFPAGVYDTKYITEFELRFSASYLEYAYKKCKLDNSRSLTSGGSGRHVHVEFCQYTGNMSTYVDYRECPVVDCHDGKTDVCERFSAFGWCPNGANCPLSHDTDLIILQDEQHKDNKRKRRKRNREKKGGGGAAAESSAISEGAPENKIPHMELDQGESDDKERVSHEMCQETAPRLDTDGDTQQIKEEKLSTESKVDRVWKEDGEPKKEINTADEENDMKTDDSVEYPRGIESRDHSSGAYTQKTDSGTHRAGFDAFMTGYIFAYSCAFVNKGKEGAKEEERKADESWLPCCLNKVYLSGKAVPLNVVKSTFAKSSKAHVQKMELVWGGRK